MKKFFRSSVIILIVFASLSTMPPVSYAVLDKPNYCWVALDNCFKRCEDYGQFLPWGSILIMACKYGCYIGFDDCGRGGVDNSMI